MIGRSHGIFAEPVTFGLALAGHHAEMARGRERLGRAREAIAVGKIAGAVGTYAHLSPAIEERALRALGLRAETVSTQVVPARSSCRAVLRDGARRGRHRAARHERPSLAALRGRRGRGGLHRRPEGLERDAPQAQPRSSARTCAASRASCVRHASRRSRTWRCGTSGTSRIRRAERMIAPDSTSTLAFMLDRARGLIAGSSSTPSASRET